MVISNTFMPALMHLLYLQLMQFLVSSVTRQLLVPDRHLEGIRDDHHWHHQLHHCSYHRHDCNCTNTLAILLQLFFWCFVERKPYKSNSSGLRKKQIWKREIFFNCFVNSYFVNWNHYELTPKVQMVGCGSAADLTLDRQGGRWALVSRLEKKLFYVLYIFHFFT